MIEHCRNLIKFEMMHCKFLYSCGCYMSKAKSNIRYKYRSLSFVAVKLLVKEQFIVVASSVKTDHKQLAAGNI